MAPDWKNVAISVNFWASSEIFTDLRSAFDSGSDKHLKTSVASIFPTRTDKASIMSWNDKEFVVSALFIKYSHRNFCDYLGQIFSMVVA